MFGVRRGKLADVKFRRSKMAKPVKTGSAKRAPVPPDRAALVWLGLIALLTAAAVLRFSGIEEAQSLWIDEAMTLAASTGHYQAFEKTLPANVLIFPPPNPAAMSDALPWWSLWHTTGLDVHPPLYYLVLRTWRYVFGDGVAAARGLSAVASVVAVGLLFELGRSLFDKTTAFWAAAIMVVAVPQVAFGQELRSYTLLLAGGLGAAVALVRIEKFGASPRRLLALGACTLAVVSVHYFGFGAALAVGIYALIRLRGNDRRKVLITFAAAGGLFLVVMGRMLWQQRLNTQQAWLLDMTPHPLLSTLQRMAKIPGHLLASRRYNSSAIDPVPPLTIWIGLLCLAPAIFYFLRRQRALLLPLLWLGCTVGVVAALDVARSTKHLDYIRYVLLAGPAIYLIAAAWPTQRSQRFWRHLLPVAAVVVAIANLPSVYQPFKQDWRGLSQYIASQGSDDEVILFYAPNEGWLTRTFYTALAEYDYSPSRPLLFVDQLPGPDLREVLQGRRAGWLVATARLKPSANFLPGYRLSDTVASDREIFVWRLAPDGPQLHR